MIGDYPPSLELGKILMEELGKNLMDTQKSMHEAWERGIEKSIGTGPLFSVPSHAEVARVCYAIEIQLDGYRVRLEAPTRSEVLALAAEYNASRPNACPGSDPPTIVEK